MRVFNMGESFDPDKLKQCEVLVLGDLMLDRYLWGNVERISPEAPVPVFHIRGESDVPGGAGNVVSNLLGLGASVTVVGICGKDPEGERIRQLLHHKKIQSHILTHYDRPTITKTRVIAQGQQMLRLDEEEIDSLDKSVQEDIIRLVRDSLPKCNAMILSDYGKGFLRAKEMVQEVIALAKENGVPVIVDPKGREWERYEGATCITPNTKELEALFGNAIPNEERLLEMMRVVIEQYGLSWLLVTRGALGMCLMDQNAEALRIPTVARQVFDVSGAGDTAIATLTACIASGYSFQDAAKIANLAAGIVVGKIGTQPISLPELSACIGNTGLDAPISRVTHKVSSLSSAARQIKAWKSDHQRIVFATGCFDLLHPAHIHLLNQSKSLGDRLVVGISSDASVRRLEASTRSILTEHDRASLVAALDCVDLVIIFEADAPEEVLKSIKPHAIVRGSEYREDEIVGRGSIEADGGQALLTPTRYSTTTINSKVVGAQEEGGRRESSISA